MATDGLFVNRAVVLGSGVVYWAGVWVQSRRIRRRIGRSTNSRPKGTREQLLWAGWFIVVAGWLALPFLPAPGKALTGAVIVPSLVHPVCSGLGILMIVAGYLGTLWCYAAMGTAWRMGINRSEKTELVARGPYRFLRHPIYLFQVIMVVAIALLLPSVLALLLLVIHVICVRTKAADEEAYLLSAKGNAYEVYCASAGRWFPRFGKREPPAAPTPAAQGEDLKPSEQPLK
jgi:protein-S-isoprenylcysteine O-methyltransferase Ste14